MSENNKNGEVGKKTLTNKIIGGVVLLVAVALIIFVRPQSEKTDEKSTDENIVVENDGALHVAQQVVSGDYTYEFTGVKWVFDTTSPEVAGTGQTWLKMELADFTRNGSAISFGRPYKLGVHVGTCRETDFIDTADQPGIPLSYAVCEGAGVKREFVAFQELEDIIIKMKETRGETVSDWRNWYSIDVTEIVR